MNIKPIHIKFTDNSDKILAEKNEAISRALISIGLKAEGFAIKQCPVDTGRLKNSITFATSKINSERQYDYSDDQKPPKNYSYQIGNVSSDNVVYVGTNVEYAQKIEFSDTMNHTVGKAHFLRDSLADNIDTFKKIIHNELKK